MNLLMAHVTNSVTNTVTEFLNYNFNSFARIGGAYYGGGDSGLCQLDVDDADTTDVVTPVSAQIATGAYDFKSSLQKRMTDMYIGFRTDGSLELDVQPDEGQVYTYELDPQGITTLQQRRAPVGKGLRGKYWKFWLRNTDGCMFDIDTIDAAMVPVSRRI